LPEQEKVDPDQIARRNMGQQMADIIDSAGMPKSGNDRLHQKRDTPIANRSLDGNCVIHLLVKQPIVVPGRRDFYPVALSVALLRSSDIPISPSRIPAGRHGVPQSSRASGKYSIVAHTVRLFALPTPAILSWGSADLYVSNFLYTRKKEEHSCFSRLPSRSAR
jgi:hypothetical protein